MTSTNETDQHGQARDMDRQSSFVGIYAFAWGIGLFLAGAFGFYLADVADSFSAYDKSPAIWNLICALILLIGFGIGGWGIFRIIVPLEIKDRD